MIVERRGRIVHTFRRPASVWTDRFYLTNAIFFAMILPMKPRLKKIGSIMAVVFGILVFYVLAEHVRGYWWLHRYVKKLEAQHEVLQVEPLLPKRVPDDQNAVIDLRQLQTNREEMKKVFYFLPPIHYYSPGHLEVQWKQQTWKYEKTNYNDWACVGRELEKNAATLDLIRSAIRKPGYDSRFDNVYQVYFMYTGFEMDVIRFLNASVQYSLSRSRTDDAYRDMLLMIRLCATHMRNPSLGEHVHRLWCFQELYNTQWNALQYPGWTDAQLAGLSEAWAGCNFEKDQISATEMTRAMDLRRFKSIRDSGGRMNTYIASFEKAPLDSEHDIGRFATRGWLLHHVNIPLWRLAWADLDELKDLSNWQHLIDLERFYFSHFFTTNTMGKVNTDGLFSLNRNWDSWFDRFRFIFSESHFCDYFKDTLMETCMVQTQIEMLRAAIAIQRYKLANGDAVPPSLTALVPKYLPSLPQDRMSGKPLCYRVRTNNRFLLYSVGIDGRDNGGNSALAKQISGYRTLWCGQDAIWYMPMEK